MNGAENENITRAQPHSWGFNKVDWGFEPQAARSTGRL
jgi:hypothetical protein